MVPQSTSLQSRHYNVYVIPAFTAQTEQKILGSNPRPSLLRLTPRTKCELKAVNLIEPRGTHTILVFGVHGRWGNFVHIVVKL
jgi:hypothetical protein